MADRMLQCVVLGRVLENPEALVHTQAGDFADDELAAVISGLKDGDLHPLRTWLANRHVQWHDGRAVEAIHKTAKTQASVDRVEKVRRRAKYLLASTHDGMATQLNKLVSQLDPP